MKNYEFELNMDDSYRDYKYIDEWGCALIWFEEYGYGAEYNFCLDGEIDSSAIYLVEYNDETDDWEDKTYWFEHYEIDFNNPNWKTELEKAMYDFVIGVINKKKQI